MLPVFENRCLQRILPRYENIHCMESRSVQEYLMQGILEHSLQIHFPCECKVSILLLERKCEEGLKDDTNVQEKISVKEEQRRERRAPEKRRDSISAQLLLELLFSERDRNNQFEIRMHSSRMRTVRNSSHLLGGGVCLVPGAGIPTCTEADPPVNRMTDRQV